MADWSGIRAAIATQMSAAPSIRESTSTKLSGVGMLPAVKVEVLAYLDINGSRGGRGAGFEARMARITGKLLVSKASDVGRAQPAAETAVEELFVAARTGLRLGYSTIVEDSWLESASVGTVEFAGVPFYGADLTWLVEVIEPATRTS